MCLRGEDTKGSQGESNNNIDNLCDSVGISILHETICGRLHTAKWNYQHILISVDVAWYPNAVDLVSNPVPILPEKTRRKIIYDFMLTMPHHLHIANIMHHHQNSSFKLILDVDSEFIRLGLKTNIIVWCVCVLCFSNYNTLKSENISAL